MLTLGNVIITDDVLQAIKDDYLSIQELKQALERHKAGDWGNLSDMDKAVNDYALKIHARIMSAYIIRGTRIWVVTEDKGTVTTVLLP